MVNVKCHNCGNEWDYGGNSTVKATCPDCNHKTPIEKEAAEAEATA